jgi:hypothetical protein
MLEGTFQPLSKKARMPDPKPVELRFFLCTGECVRYSDLSKYPNSHIIGHLCYVTDEDKRVTALARWEASVSTIQVPPLKPLIDCMMIGDVRNIKCRYPGCNRKERWEIGKAAFLALMSRYGKEVMPT